MTGPAYFTAALDTYTWTGGGNGSWSATTAASWTTSGGSFVAWANGENMAVFNSSGSGTHTIVVDGYTSAHGLLINSGATGYSFGGGSLIITGSGIVANESVTINSPVTVGAPQTWTVAAGKQITLGGVDLNISPLSIAGAGNTVINGVVSDIYGDPILGSAWTGAVGNLTVLGPGTVTLGAANTFSGNTLVSGGTLLLANALALQNSTFDSSGSGTLSFGGQTAFSFGGLTGPGNIALTNSAGAGMTLTVGGNGVSTTYSGNLSGNGASLVMSGSGMLTLSGINSFTGPLIVGNGSVSSAAINDAGTSGPLGEGTVILGSGGSVGVLVYSGSGTTSARPFTIAAAGTGGFAVSTGAALTLTGQISGGGSLLMTGPGLLALAGSSSYSGATLFNGGEIEASSIASFGSNPSLIFNGGGIQFGAAFDPSVVPMTFQSYNATLDTNGYNITLAKPIGNGGAGGLTKTGAGTLTLTASNSFSGNVYVNAGVLNVQNSGALGSGEIVDVAAGTALQLQGGIALPAETLNLYGTGIANDGALRNISGNNTFSAMISLGVNARINSDSGTLILSSTAQIRGYGYDLTIGGAGNVTLQSPILSTPGAADISGLTKDGAGTLTMTASNTYSGPTSVVAGTLRLAGSGSLPSSGKVYVRSAGTLDLNGTNQTVGSISSTAGGLIANSASGTTSVLTVNLVARASTTYAGSLSDGAGVLALNESGSGRLVLSGTNAYSGGTTVSSGTLDIAGSASLPSSGVLVVGRSGMVVLGSSGSGASMAQLLAATPSALADSAATGLTLLTDGIDSTVSSSESGDGSTEASAALGEAVPGSSGVSPSGSSAAVPEPGTMALLAAVALCALAAWRRGRF
jgi:autotransporter-associated beta strand protein